MLTIIPLLILDPAATSWQELLEKGDYAWTDPYLVAPAPRPLAVLGLASFDRQLTHEALRSQIRQTDWDWADAWDLAAVGARFPNMEDVFALGTVHEHAEYGPCSPAIERRQAGRALTLDPLPARWSTDRQFLVRRRP